MAGMSAEFTRFLSARQKSFSVSSGISCRRFQRFRASIPPQRGFAFHFQIYARSIHSRNFVKRSSFCGGSKGVSTRSLISSDSPLRFNFCCPVHFSIACDSSALDEMGKESRDTCTLYARIRPIMHRTSGIKERAKTFFSADLVTRRHNSHPQAVCNVTVVNIFCAHKTVPPSCFDFDSIATHCRSSCRIQIATTSFNSSSSPRFISLGKLMYVPMWSSLEILISFITLILLSPFPFPPHPSGVTGDLATLFGCQFFRPSLAAHSAA